MQYFYDESHEFHHVRQWFIEYSWIFQQTFIYLNECSGKCIIHALHTKNICVCVWVWVWVYCLYIYLCVCVCVCVCCFSSFSSRLNVFPISERFLKLYKHMLPMSCAELYMHFHYPNGVFSSRRTNAKRAMPESDER